MPIENFFLKMLMYLPNLDELENKFEEVATTSASRDPPKTDEMQIISMDYSSIK